MITANGEVHRLTRRARALCDELRHHQGYPAGLARALAAHDDQGLIGVEADGVSWMLNP